MTRNELVEYIKEEFSGELEVIENDRPEPYIVVKKGDVLDFARFIHDDPRLMLHFLMNLSAVDTEDRFEMVYNVCSYRHKHRILFKVLIDNHDKPEIESVHSIWPAANWYEREAWELFGINILNHPYLKRFLLPDDWDQGNPMRKDWVGKDVIPMPER